MDDSAAAASAPGSSAGHLLIGVITFSSPQALERRDAQRRLCNATGAHVTLRFVLGSPDVDSRRGDVLTFAVARDDRRLGTFLLTNAFFRHALAQPGVTHIARADDDAVFDAGAIGHALLFSRRMPWRAAEHLVFGPFGEWYMWNRETLTPACFAYYSFRWWTARQAARELEARRAAGGTPPPPQQQLARSQYECVAPNVVGPFPYAKGPFVAYSRAVAAAMSRRFDADEKRALERHTRPLPDAYGTTRAPGHRHHPSRMIVYDDVYYASLVFELFGNRSLTLVRAPLSEYVKERPQRLQRALVYHKLKHPKRFEYVANNSAALTTRDGWERGALCPKRQRAGWARALSTHDVDCCSAWRGCEWGSFVKWQDRPPRANPKSWRRKQQPPPSQRRR